MLTVPKASVHGGDSTLLLLKGELSSPSHRNEGISWKALRINPQDPAAIARDAWRFEGGTCNTVIDLLKSHSCVNGAIILACMLACQESQF